jgi:hypothetical protein
MCQYFIIGESYLLKNGNTNTETLQLNNFNIPVKEHSFRQLQDKIGLTLNGVTYKALENI